MKRSAPAKPPAPRLTAATAARVASTVTLGMGLGLGLGLVGPGVANGMPLAAAAETAPIPRGTAATLAQGTTAATTLTQGTATATDVRLDSQVVDKSGVLSPSERDEIAGMLQQGVSKSNIKLYIVFVPNIPTEDPKAYAQQLRSQVRTNNTMVLVTGTQDRRVGTDWGASVSKTTAGEIQDAAVKKFAADDFNAGAQAAARKVAKKTDPATLGWMGAAGVAVVGGGAGAFWWSKRRRKERETQQFEAAKSLSPTATDDLARQPTPVLWKLAQDELQSTDESIRKGEQEYATAQEEFGSERTRSLARAVQHSREALNRAHGIHQQLRIDPHRDENEVRQLLVDIISTCGSADEQLNGEAENFSALRRELIDAPKLLGELTQRIVDARARIAPAEHTVEQLKQRLGEQQVKSIADNPAIAKASVDAAEEAVGHGRELAAKPAGQQAGLVDAISAARMALGQADSLLNAVEHAEERLSAARTNLTALIAEVEDEIREAEGLLAGQADIDRKGLSDAATAAKKAVAEARQSGDTDPLGSYSALLEADSALDVELDEARGADNDYRRTIEMVDRTLSDVDQYIRAVESTIHTRGSMIGVDARTAAQSARAQLDAAAQVRAADPKAAMAHAQSASQLAREATQLVERDMEEFSRRNNYYGGGYGGGFG
ncbi:TPM domain-containing protein, partial [Corynebacterium heidelbergense]